MLLGSALGAILVLTACHVSATSAPRPGSSPRSAGIGYDPTYGQAADLGIVTRDAESFAKLMVQASRMNAGSFPYTVDLAASFAAQQGLAVTSGNQIAWYQPHGADGVSFCMENGRTGAHVVFDVSRDAATGQANRPSQQHSHPGPFHLSSRPDASGNSGGCPPEDD